MQPTSAQQILNKKTFLTKHPTLARLASAFTVLFTMAAAGEITLRLAGVVPYETVYKLVDKLEVYDRYMTDETGMLKMNPSFDFGEGYFINTEGFRDSDIQAQSKSSNPKIMFVGDSFTWGASAKPITNSFADLIEQRHITAFNFGIPGVGPVQYAAVVKKYLPVVDPDMVAVMVYLGNDINQYREKLESYKLPQYSTNAGSIYAFDKNGNHMTPQQAYNYYYGHFYAKLEYYSRKSALLYTLGKRLIGLRNRIVLSRYRASNQTSANEDRNQYAIDSFKQIQAMARARGKRCYFFIIPVRPSRRHSENSYENAHYIFAGLDTVYVDFGEECYAQDQQDTHFNNLGHEKLMGIVKDVLNHPDSPLIDLGSQG